MTGTARRVAETAARTSYGKLLAILASRTRDIARAEDALAHAFAKALEIWPERGVPANPDAWLVTTARNTMTNDHRHDRVRDASAAELARHYDALADSSREFADERLKLLFVCAHPAIDPAARTPLMLQTVLGLDAARIAASFMIQPATMSQRLVRAKARIRETGLRFDVPEADRLRDRLPDVLDAIYAAFGTGWDAGADQPDGLRGLPEEAIYLARLLLDLLPDAPDAMGLLSLMLFTHARRAARRGPDGAFVPLDAQDARLWDRNMVIEAETLLTTAARFGQFGRYLCEAAIQSVHAQRAVTGRLNLGALETLYRLLITHHPTIGGGVALASVLRQQGRLAEALAMLDGFAVGEVATYQPLWVLRAHCQRDLAQPFTESAGTALRLTSEPALRAYLAQAFGLSGSN